MLKWEEKKYQGYLQDWAVRIQSSQSHTAIYVQIH